MSTTATAPKSFDALTAEIEKYNGDLAKAANLASQAPEKDPANKGTKDIPKDPEATPAKIGVPSNNTNTNGAPEALAAICETNPVPVGEDVPSTVAGDPKDKSVCSPTDPLSKIAKEANDVLASMAAFQTSQLTGSQKAAASAGTPATSAAAPVAGAPVKAAGTDTNLPVQWTPEFHFKVAQVMLETEEGCRAVESVLTKKAGLAAAQELIGRALHAQATFNQQVELEKAATQAQADGVAAADELLKNASESDKAAIVKFATVHGSNLRKCANAYEVQAYNLGAMDAAAILDSAQAIKAARDKKAGMPPDPTGGAGGPPPGAGGPPPGAGGPPPGAGGDPSGGAGGDPSIPGGGQGPMELPEIMQLLAEMVQNGEIPQEVGQALAQQLQQAAAGGAGGAPGGDPGGAPGGDANPSPDAGGPPGGGAPGGAAPDGGGAPTADDEPEEAKAARVLFHNLTAAAA